MKDHVRRRIKSGIIHIGVGDSRSHAAGVINIIIARRAKSSSQQEDQESSAADQGGAISDQEDQNVHKLQVQSTIPLEIPHEEHWYMVERAYVYLKTKKGTYPEGVTKNENRQKAE